jgi:hypothetical protein
MMKQLKEFVARENQFAKIFGKKPLDLNSAADRQKIADKIDMQLSPENLSCDGELSRAETNRRYRNLNRCAEQLLQLDPAVKFYEYC